MNQNVGYVMAKSFTFGEAGEFRCDHNGVHIELKQREGGWSLVQSMLLKVVVERIRATCALTLPDMQIVPDDSRQNFTCVIRSKGVKISEEEMRNIADGLWAQKNRVGPLPRVETGDDKKIIELSKKVIPGLSKEYAMDAVIADRINAFNPFEKSIYTMLKGGLGLALNFYFSSDKKYESIKGNLKSLKLEEIISKVNVIEETKHSVPSLLESKAVQRTLYAVTTAYAEALNNQFGGELCNPQNFGWTGNKIVQAVQLNPTPRLLG